METAYYYLYYYLHVVSFMVVLFLILGGVGYLIGRSCSSSFDPRSWLEMERAKEKFVIFAGSASFVVTMFVYGISLPKAVIALTAIVLFYALFEFMAYCQLAGNYKKWFTFRQFFRFTRGQEELP